MSYSNEAFLLVIVLLQRKQKEVSIVQGHAVKKKKKKGHVCEHLFFVVYETVEISLIGAMTDTKF